MNDDLKTALTDLTKQVETLNNHAYIKRQNSIWSVISMQVLRGLAFGLGSVIGASLLVSLLLGWLSSFEVIPVIGQWISQIVDQIEQAR